MKFSSSIAPNFEITTHKPVSDHTFSCQSPLGLGKLLAQPVGPV
jgi:hypothetical protein